MQREINVGLVRAARFALAAVNQSVMSQEAREKLRAAVELLYAAEARELNAECKPPCAD